MEIKHPINISFDNEDLLFYWLEQSRNPPFWAELIMNMNYDSSITPKVVHWVVSQKDCDIGTAILAFASIEGARFVYRNNDEQRQSFTEKDSFLTVAKTICENSEDNFYKSNNVGSLRSGRDQDYLIRSFKEIEEDETYDVSSNFMPKPSVMLNAELPPTPFPKGDFMVDETGIYHLDNFDENFKNIYKLM